jgi:hypothetical protein
MPKIDISKIYWKKKCQKLIHWKECILKI